MTRLNDAVRDKLKQVLANDRMSSMFGDGLERDYIMDGCTIVGLNQMSDEDLVEEYEQGVSEDDEFLAELKAELGIEKILA